MGNNQGAPATDLAKAPPPPPGAGATPGSAAAAQGFKPMAKHMTFDERSLSSHQTRLGEFGVGAASSDFTQLKRASTFHSDATSEGDAKRFAFRDVQFRQHFNLQPLKKMPSMQGLQVFKQPLAPVPEAQPETIVVVDTFSTGAVVAFECMQRGYQVICVVSFKDCGSLAEMVPEGIELNFAATLIYDDTNPDDAAALENLVSDIEGCGLGSVTAVLPGAETGVKLCDRLSERLGTTTNGSAGTEARRNKYDMGEKVRAAGVRAVHQRMATTWSDIETFLAEWQPSPFEVIVKPVESAGSDDVTLCLSVTEVQKAFGKIMGNRNGLGQINQAVLVQEYLRGREYVVDTVSRNGEHKVVAMWDYDRNPTNGAGFVLHGQRFMTADEEFATQLMEYDKQVLDALGIVHGPAHAEIKMCNGEPVLVEVGARCHGAEGFWCPIANQCVGYNQATATLDAYLAEADFTSLPPTPAVRTAYGCMKFLLSYVKGTNCRINQTYIEEIKSMKSFIAMDLLVKDGQDLVPTIDCFTWAGSVRLAHPEKAVMDGDYARIHEMELTDLFLVDSAEDGAAGAEAADAAAGEGKGGAIVVVDPFSTGAIVAANVNKAGRPCICVYSARLENMDNLENFVPAGLELHFDAVVGQTVDDPDQALKDTMAQLEALSADILPISAVLAGAETGVLMADKLSEALSLRTNGAASSEPRRNKYLMGEKVRAAGVRAVQQCMCTQWDEVEAFLESSGLEQLEPYKIILKPLESAGSDGVTLCGSRVEVKTAFEKLHNSTNQLGLQNTSVLVQEFLDGVEYVVDSVSLDGVHTTTAVWQYDKRPANGQFNVYYGQSALTMSEEPAPTVVAYIHSVLDALEIRQGPSHAEVKMCRGEPVLVEVGARCHGAEGAWIEVAHAIYGYDQAQVTLDAYMAPEKFALIPKLPETRIGNGRLIFIVSYFSGTLARVNETFLREIEGFASFAAMEIFLKPGEKVSPTVDCFTFVGNIRLTHGDAAVVDRDYNRVREIELDAGFLVMEP